MADPKNFNIDDDAAISRYLLGLSQETERAAIQERIFQDEDYFERVRSVQQELIDAYVRGELSNSEREQVKAVLLSAGRGKGDLAFARALAAVTGAHAPKPRRAFQSAPVWIGLIAATLVVAAGVGYWVVVGQRNAGRESAEVSAPQRPTAPKSTAVLSVVLTPGVLRGSEKRKQIVIPPGTDTVQLQLDVENDRHASYSAMLKTNAGETAWEQNGLSRQPDQSVLCNVPAVALKPASYELALKGGSDTVGYYYFVVSQ